MHSTSIGTLYAGVRALIAVRQMITGGLSKSTEKQLYARLLGQAGTGRKGGSSTIEGEVKVSHM